MLFTSSDVAVEVWEGRWKKEYFTVMCTALDIALCMAYSIIHLMGDFVVYIYFIRILDIFLIIHFL